MLDTPAIVSQMYAAFGRGDIPAILKHVSDAAVWEYGGTPEIPWLVPRRGRAGAAAFFESLQTLQIHRFEVKAIVGSGALVVGLVDIDCAVKATGRRVVEEDEVHLWHFDAHGQVARFRHRADTLAHWRALAA